MYTTSDLSINQPTSALSTGSQTNNPTELDEKSSLYLNFLPEIYREINFIGRFLKIFENTFEPIVDQLEAMWAYLDPMIAPESMLPFLAYWVGWQSLPELELSQQRRLIANALKIYQLRGTKAGLKLYLHLYTGISEDDVEIIDYFPPFILEESELDESTYLDGNPYHFIVKIQVDPKELNSFISCLEAALATAASFWRRQSLNLFISLVINFYGQLINYFKIIYLIIEQQKPAWCTYDVVLETSINENILE